MTIKWGFGRQGSGPPVPQTNTPVFGMESHLAGVHLYMNGVFCKLSCHASLSANPIDS